jgi:ADP-ribose pyrophosphatase YjhB (NUDIX family)
MKKHKAIAIPVTFETDDKKPRFLTVRDRRWHEWIFVTGGCRKREITSPLRCALRELEEETRGCMNLRSGCYTEFSFTVKDKEEGVDLVYSVYVFFVDVNNVQRQAMVKKFSEEKAKMQLRKHNKLPIKRVYDENDFMSWDTLEDFNRRKQWKMQVDHILKNPEFYSAVSSQYRKTFNYVK